MRRATAVAALLLGVSAVPASAPARSLSADVVVTTSDDLVNGSISSVAALNASPGPDGVSLREALTAANKSSGPLEITFSSALAGQTIMPSTPLPAITRDGVELVGSNVSISGASLGDQGGVVGLLDVLASRITVRGLTLDSIPTGWAAILVRGGKNATPSATGPQQISDIRIDHDNFVGAGGNITAWGVSIGTSGPGGGQNVTLSSIWIGDNTFAHFRGDGDAVLLGLGTSNNTVTNVVVHDNTIRDTTFGIELAPGSTGSENTISSVQVLHNTFNNDQNPLSLNNGHSGSNGNAIQHTVIAGNTMTGVEQNAIDIAAGHDGAAGNSIIDTQIVNNLMTGHGILLVGGDGGGSDGNRVSDVRVTNDTISNPNEPAFDVYSNLSGATGNSITDLLVTNTIVDGNFNGEVTPSTVRSSLVAQNSFSGTNSNILASAGFVGGGDYHLGAGSPAVNAGVSDGAPATDLDGHARSDGHPDIGAYEFRGVTLPALTVSVAEAGAATGEITSSPAGIDCPGICSGGFQQGATVTLTATAWPGATFSGWSGACSGAATCSVTVATSTAVAAGFAATARAPVAKKTPPKCKKGQRSTKKHPCRR